MERLSLKVKLRDDLGKGPSRRLRTQGLIPAVLYGQSLDPINLTVNHRELEKATSGAGGTNVLFDLEIEGKETLPVMIKEFQADVIGRQFTHVDFLKLDLSKKISVEVPVHLVGKSIGVKEGGILEHIRRTLEVKCLPTAIPESLDVDVTDLAIGDTIHVHDLKLPEGVELPPGADVTIAAVVAPAAEKEATPAEAAEDEAEAKEEGKSEEKK